MRVRPWVGPVGRIGTGIVALALVLVVGAAACSSPVTTTPATTAASTADVASPVTGVLTHIDAAGLTQVAGFTLRIADGRELAFTIGTLENGNVFAPGHLVEHLQALSPVRVFFRREGQALVVYRLEDVTS